MMTLIYLDGLNGINYHRLMTPFLRLKAEEGLEIHFFEDFNELKDWDLSKVKNLVVSRRCSVSNHKEFKKYLVDNDIKLILDNDDYWNLPKHNPAHDYYKNVEGPNIKATIAIADEIWSPSKYLIKIMRKINSKPIYRLIPNTIYENEKQWADPQKDASPELKVRFGYVGANGHQKDLDRMGMTFEDHELYSMNLMDYPERLKAKYRMNPVDITQYAHLYKYFDVSLSPLENTIFNRCKSELKVVEAGYTKTAIIASNVRPYKQAIINGKTGILCSSPGEWREAIKTMTIERAEDLANNLYEHCVKEYDLHTINKTRIEGLG
jgi:glycosyltransferase involved in cell wall biosynthesis